MTRCCNDILRSKNRNTNADTDVWNCFSLELSLVVTWTRLLDIEPFILLLFGKEVIPEYDLDNEIDEENDLVTDSLRRKSSEAATKL